MVFLGLVQMGTISSGQGSRWRDFRRGVIGISIDLCLLVSLVFWSSWVSIKN